ncbi:hypothetical protein A3B93_00715 [Candidatus Nomurabacteria bacterium RIFCSPHIGHO2_02_FULL_42_24]|uniref:Transcobalamin-like C-terminal domain-containing protein n=1 Tax=Candidatus Nomurabacteria bacterium RIFCSPHIGHO2_02_FULL_42_24 TaxID=1801757 RepID=A0A1F6WHY3_9BACT|nr:MAG: hypothetical protein A3B93_00715 [Candidatus Nomurabacteria bacterium RIFCSPHIGHO2_02_FULL_42_24]
MVKFQNKSKYILIAFVLAAVALSAIFLYVSRDNIILENFSAATGENLQISLKVGTQTYALGVEPGATVLQTMQKLSTESDFSFNGREFPGLGYFVEEINGVKGNADKFWAYYVNDVLAPTGVSQYVLKTGDIINFKYEKII